MKIFGIELFNKKKKIEFFIMEAQNSIKDDKYLPDFFKNYGRQIYSDLELSTVTMDVPPSPLKKKRGRPAKKETSPTPKEVYTLKMLNEEGFQINTDPAYIDKQIDSFKERLSLLKAAKYDMANGVQETASILLRMENRKKYAQFSTFFEQYPYTTNKKILELLKKYTHLKIDTSDTFVPDFPQEAIDNMKKYKEEVQKLSGKFPMFYVIAEKKDFQKTENRRDPILLAQSPFGHFWQILGAWDKEMLLLDEL